MKVNWFLIKMFVLTGVIVFLSIFAVQRNGAREVKDITIAFHDESTPFVTRETVNKLLIVSAEKGVSEAKENLALSELEKRVNAHPIIKKADVYVSMSGKLGIAIEQRKPIARMNMNPAMYMGASGEMMPLSDNFSAHVPLVSGTTIKDSAQVYKLASFIKNDSFLAKQIIGVSRKSNGEYILKARKQDYIIELGDVKQLEKRFSNYKAFYQKSLKDKSLKNYKKISLKFKGQVVCERKDTKKK